MTRSPLLLLPAWTPLALALFLLLAPRLYAADPRPGAVLDALQPGHWYEAPGTAMIAVAAKAPQDLGSVHNIMRAWNGAAYDTKRDRLIVWGGGHVDYGGNEVYVFDVNQLKWERLTQPSPTTFRVKGGKLNSAAGQTDPRWNGDQTPISKHSYDGLEYLPEPLDKLLQYGGSRWFMGGEDELAWGFDFKAGKWQRLKDAPGTALTPVSARDPKTGNYYVQTSSKFLEYDPGRDAWSVIGTTAGWGGDGTGEIDPVRRRFLAIERGQMYYYDLEARRPLKRQKLATSGATEIERAHAPGFAYSPKADRFVAWSGSITDDAATGLGDTVYLLDPETLVWTKCPPVGPVAPPKGVQGSYPGSSNGTFGRWRYIPSRDLCIGVNNVTSNVFFYRLPATPPSAAR